MMPHAPQFAPETLNIDADMLSLNDDEFEDEFAALGLGKTLRNDIDDDPLDGMQNLDFGGGNTSDNLLASMAAEERKTINGRSLRWVRGETIGRGTMGTVFQAMDPVQGSVFAVKEVVFQEDNEEDLAFRKQLQTELEIVKEVQHLRVVSYKGHDYFDGCLFIYMEIMHGGSLATVLKQFGALDVDMIQVYTQQLLEGLTHLHSQKPPVLHRDIKGANILVGTDGSVKLSDFGCSKRTMETMAHTLKGSIPWMAPEVIANTGYGRRADIWSLGCVLIEMASASSPWGKLDNPMAAMFRISMGKEGPPMPEVQGPEALARSCIDFIRQCVQRDKQKRPYAEQLQVHDFVKDLEVKDCDQLCMTMTMGRSLGRRW